MAQCEEKFTMGSWVPEIAYEESAAGGITSNIPFITVPQGEEMPKVLFVFESRDTGEIEPGSEGEDVPVVELELHQYVDMAVLKSGLTGTEYDRVRYVLGLQPLAQATAAGKKITDRVREKLES
jgi:hypothetical protein